MASVMHTGTMFTLEVIEELTHKRVLPWGYTFQDGGRAFDWLHVHVDPSPESHPWDAYRFLRRTLCQELVCRVPTVVPVRDPVLALISKENRRNREIGLPDEGAWLWIVDAFEEIARWWEREERRIFWFPVDLQETRVERLDLLHDLATFTGVEPDPDAVEAIAARWEARNRTPDRSGLKGAYRTGSLEAVRRTLPLEMERLEESPRIERMYRAMGYRSPWIGRVP